MSQSVWQLTYRESGRPENNAISRHDTRDLAIGALTGHLIDAGITVYDDPNAAARNATDGDFSATLTAPDGTRISYVIRSVKLPTRYLNQAEFAERIGVSPNSMGRYKLPDPDAVTGPINEDGTIPRGTVRGWTVETIDKWNASRPGRGARTDLGEP